MRIRVVLSGVSAAVICIFVLRFPWYVQYPASLDADWLYADAAANLPPWVETGALFFCAFTIFTFGWVAARWNWENNWRGSLLAGAGAGFLAGCLVYDFIGAFHYSLLAHEEILQAYFVTLTETQGITLVVEGVSKAAYFIYLNFLAVITSAAVLGGLGGAVSAFDAEDVWGSSPRNPDGWLFRLPAYTLVATGAACVIVAYAAFIVLQESITEAAVKGNLRELDTMPIYISLLAYLVCLAMALFPLGLTWGWAIRAWKTAGTWRVLYALWVGGALLAVGSLYVQFIQSGSVFLVLPIEGLPLLPYDWFFIPLVLLAGVGVGMLFSSPPISDSRHRASDRLGYALTQGILGGTQIFVSLPAYALSLTLITVVNIPHLMNSGIVSETPAQQISTLYDVMWSAAGWSILLSFFGGLFFGGVVSLIRRFLQITPAQPPTPPEIPVFEA